MLARGGGRVCRPRKTVRPTNSQRSASSPGYEGPSSSFLCEMLRLSPRRGRRRSLRLRGRPRIVAAAPNSGNSARPTLQHVPAAVVLSVPAMTDFSDNIDAFIKSVQHQSRMTHAAVVIAAVSILDAQLERVLKRALRPMSKRMYARLFDSFRPLNTFSSKIIMAYAVGAITHDAFDELEKIRAIRNEFAHSSEILHFESSSIAPKFLSLKRPPTASTKPTEVFLACVRVIDKSLEDYLLSTAVCQDRQIDPF